MAPVATRAARAACEGIIGYGSASWTSPELPTAYQSARRPVRSAAGGVSASTGKPLSAASTINRGVTGRGVAVGTKIDWELAQARVEGRERRHVKAAGSAHHDPSAADGAQLLCHLEEHPRPPAAADQRERGHSETLMPSPYPAASPVGGDA